MTERDTPERAGNPRAGQAEALKRIHRLEMDHAFVPAIDSCVICAARAGASREERAGEAQESGEVCRRCHEPVGVVWAAPDDLWWKVAGGPAGILCVRCFSESAAAVSLPVWFDCRRHTAEPCIPVEAAQPNAESATDGDSIEVLARLFDRHDGAGLGVASLRSLVRYYRRTSSNVESAAVQSDGGMPAPRAACGHVVHEPTTTCERCVQALRERCEGLAQGRERLLDALHSDRTGLAAALAKVKQAAQARQWIMDGRGSYEWDDEEYRREAGYALGEVVAIVEAALIASGNLAHAHCCGRAALSGGGGPSK